MKRSNPTGRGSRQSVDIGPGLCQVSPVMYWYKHGHFKNDDEARGAFELAYQQGLDGMGRSTREWMGLTLEQFAAWMRDGTLPPR
jgi:hypothetical protein